MSKASVSVYSISKKRQMFCPNWKMFGLTYITLGISLCNIVKSNTNAINQTCEPGISLASADEKEKCLSHQSVANEIMCFPCQHYDLKDVARSNLMFTIEMYRSLTFKNDVFKFNPRSFRTILNHKYESPTNKKFNLMFHRCGLNGKQDNGKSIVFSPYTIRSLMATVVIGMRERFNPIDTYLCKRLISYNLFPGMDWKDKILTATVRSYNVTDRLLHGMSEMTKKFVLLSEQYNALPDSNGDFLFSNIMYVQEGFEILPDYKKKFNVCLNVHVKEIDFFNISLVKEVARNSSLAPDLFPIAHVLNEKKVVLLSKLKFWMQLEQPFYKESTTTELFKTSFIPTEKDDEYDYVVQVKMLNQKGAFSICLLPNATAIQLDYQFQKHLSLIVILPDDSSNLYDIQPSMNNPYIHDKNNNLALSTQDAEYAKHLKSCFDKWDKNVKNIKLSIPKLQIDQAYSLKHPFTLLRTEYTEEKIRNPRRQWSIFTEETPINKPAYLMYKNDDTQPPISDILHTISFRLNDLSLPTPKEKMKPMIGTKQQIETEGFEDIQEFKFDRPFMFFVQENSTGAILIAGRVTNPTTKDPYPVLKPKWNTTSAEKRTYSPTKWTTQALPNKKTSDSTSQTSTTAISKSKANSCIASDMLKFSMFTALFSYFNF